MEEHDKCRNLNRILTKLPIAIIKTSFKQRHFENSGAKGLGRNSGWHSRTSESGRSSTKGYIKSKILEIKVLCTIRPLCIRYAKCNVPDNLWIDK